MIEDCNITIVRNFIVKSLLFGESSKLCPETNFMESGILDSTGMIELISFLELEFNIKINDWELIPDNFSSLQKISDYIKRKTKSRLIKEVKNEKIL